MSGSSEAPVQTVATEAELAERLRGQGLSSEPGLTESLRRHLGQQVAVAQLYAVVARHFAEEVGAAAEKRRRALHALVDDTYHEILRHSLHHNGE